MNTKTPLSPSERAVKPERTYFLAAGPYMLRAFESIIKVLGGSQPKDIPGAIMIAQSAIEYAKTGKHP